MREKGRKRLQVPQNVAARAAVTAEPMKKRVSGFQQNVAKGDRMRSYVTNFKEVLDQSQIDSTLKILVSRLTCLFLHRRFTFYNVISQNFPVFGT